MSTISQALANTRKDSMSLLTGSRSFMTSPANSCVSGSKLHRQMHACIGHICRFDVAPHGDLFLRNFVAHTVCVGAHTATCNQVASIRSLINMHTEENFRGEQIVIRRAPRSQILSVIRAEISHAAGAQLLLLCVRLEIPVSRELSVHQKAGQKVCQARSSNKLGVFYMPLRFLQGPA